MYFGMDSKYHPALHVHFKCNNEVTFFFLPCYSEGDKLATAGSPNTWCTSTSEFRINMHPGSSISSSTSQPVMFVVLVLLAGGVCVPEEEMYK